MWRVPQPGGTLVLFWEWPQTWKGLTEEELVLGPGSGLG